MEKHSYLVVGKDLLSEILKTREELEEDGQDTEEDVRYEFIRLAENVLHRVEGDTAVFYEWENLSDDDENTILRFCDDCSSDDEDWKFLSFDYQSENEDGTPVLTDRGNWEENPFSIGWESTLTRGKVVTGAPERVSGISPVSTLFTDAKTIAEAFERASSETWEGFFGTMFSAILNGRGIVLEMTNGSDRTFYRTLQKYFPGESVVWKYVKVEGSPV